MINIVASAVQRIERPDAPLAEVTDDRVAVTGSEPGAALADLDAVLPAVHSFGRRGALICADIRLACKNGCTEHLYVRGRPHSLLRDD